MENKSKASVGMRHLKFVQSLFSSYYEELKWKLSSRLADESNAEEIVQDVFHNILKLDDFDENVQNHRAYLHRAASNLALNRIRKKANEDAYLGSVVPEYSTTSLEDDFIVSRDIEIIRRRFRAMPAITRKVFILSRVEQKTYPEISRELNISISSVQKHMMKTLKFLRDHLEVDE